MQDLVARVLRGEVRATARACRIVDDRGEGYRSLLQALYPHAQRAYWLGITGGPGVGKSTLTARLIERFRRMGQRVGVVAIDPSSPFSGGAVLGDRIRMQQHFEDPEVFIRSSATRGAQGGLSRSALDIARVLSAWGANVVLIETVGVGQDELDVAFAAETTLMVLAPGMGDSIQALKAGLLECAHVFAVNKGDLPGVESTVADLEQMLALGRDVAPPTSAFHGRGHGLHSLSASPSAHNAGKLADNDAWQKVIVRSVATQNLGIDELLVAILAHRDWSQNSAAGRQERRLRARRVLFSYLKEEVLRIAVEERGQQLEALVERVENGSLDPYSACQELLGGG